jgi:coenzyme Q-binding protein COQ10
MPQFSTRRRVAHSATEMFDLVADIERYPEFVPLCRAMRVMRRTCDNGREVVIAEMTVSYKVIRETFTSRVVLDREHLAIEVSYLDGPFSRMENKWRFHPLDGSVGDGNAPSDSGHAEGGAAACEVEFFISYEFRSRALALLMGAMFDAAFRRFASAFERRADLVFGRA